MSLPCHIESCDSSDSPVYNALTAVGAFDVLAQQSVIVLKPNLVNASPPPVTFPVKTMEALIRAIRKHSDADLIIAEGCGDLDRTTAELFELHGYTDLAERYGVELIDLNEAPLRRLTDPSCSTFPEMYLPEILFNSFLISAPVLKAHSLAGVTIAMKNMIGCAPPSHYQQGGSWKKSAFHRRMHQSILDLNRYRKPDLCFVDARTGLAEYHLGGAECNPPVNRFIAGFDPVAVDVAGAQLLGQDWQQIEHLRFADGTLGSAKAGLQALKDSGV
jgi:uncharacterized protein (DUF362 family)